MTESVICLNCTKRDAMVTCELCKSRYCETCDQDIHQGPRLSQHERLKIVTSSSSSENLESIKEDESGGALESVAKSTADYGIPLQLCLECDNEVEGQVCYFCGNDQFRIVSSKEVPQKHQWPIVIDGFLFKLGGKKKARSWQRRYFKLDEKSNLTYHKTDQLHINQLDEELGRIDVRNAVITSFDLHYFEDRDGYIWGIRPDGAERQYLLEAEDYIHRKIWIKALVDQGAIQGEHKSAKRLHSKALVEQYMFKKGGFRRNWKRRWFTLLQKPPVITYVARKDAVSKLLGSIEITKTTEVKEGSRTGFEILIKSTPAAKRTYHIRTIDERQRQQWIIAIQALVDNLNGASGALARDFMPIMSPVAVDPGKQRFEF